MFLLQVASVKWAMDGRISSALLVRKQLNKHVEVVHVQISFGHQSYAEIAAIWRIQIALD
jgi:hypothetical protein